MHVYASFWDFRFDTYCWNSAFFGSMTAIGVVETLIGIYLDAQTKGRIGLLMSSIFNLDVIETGLFLFNELLLIIK